MKLPPCAKRKPDPRTGIPMCYAIGCCEVGDMPCECEGCLKAHGGRCPRRKEKNVKSAKRAR